MREQKRCAANVHRLYRDRQAEIVEKSQVFPGAPNPRACPTRTPHKPDPPQRAWASRPILPILRQIGWARIIGRRLPLRTLIPLKNLIFQLSTVASVVFSGSVVKCSQATPNHPRFGVCGQYWTSRPHPDRPKHRARPIQLPCDSDPNTVRDRSEPHERPIRTPCEIAPPQGAWASRPHPALGK